jgi:DNA-binding transcriptional LysR family regulator
MDIRYLFEFVNVAEKLNFSDAADDLFMSQATLSKHIAAMEEELGCKLFDRSTHQVALTESGKIAADNSIQITKRISCMSG